MKYFLLQLLALRLMLSVIHYAQWHRYQVVPTTVCICMQTYVSLRSCTQIIHEYIQMRRDMFLILHTFSMFMNYNIQLSPLDMAITSDFLQLVVVFKNMQQCLQYILMLPVFVYCLAVNETKIITYSYNYINCIHNSHLNYNRKLVSVLICNRCLLLQQCIHLISIHSAISYR